MVIANREILQGVFAKAFTRAIQSSLLDIGFQV